MELGSLRWDWLRGVQLCMIALLFAGMAPNAVADPDYAATWGPSVGSQAPLLAANDQDGEPQTVETLSGAKGLLMVFNRSVDWCPFCQRQFMELNEITKKFEALGVKVAGMTYDEPDEIKQFHQKWKLAFPILRDVDRQHVDAWGIRNEEYNEGSFAYGIPHPGVVLLSPEGKILAKFAEPGYRSRADWPTVLEEVRKLVGGA